MKPRERKSTSFRDDIDIIPDSEFDGGTYRKPKIVRTETFTKKPQSNTYIFGDERRRSQSRETSYDSRYSDDSQENLQNNDDRVTEVMSWFVDVNPPTRAKPVLGERREINYHTEKYKSSPKQSTPPKPLPRTSLVKRNDTFRVNEPIQVAIERKPSNKSHQPIRIEIRNPPPLSDREHEMSRPIGIATPYNNNKIIINKKSTPTITRSTSSSIQYRDPRVTAPVRSTQNDVAEAYNSFTQDRFDSIRRKFSNSPRLGTTMPRERLPTPSPSPPPKPSRLSTLSRNQPLSNTNGSPSNESKSKTLTRSKKLQKLWTTFNNKMQPKKRNSTEPISRYSYTSQVIQQEGKNSEFNDKFIPTPTPPQHKPKSGALREKLSLRERFSSPSVTSNIKSTNTKIERNPSIKEKSKIQSRDKSPTRGLSTTTARKSNTTASTFSWLMKVKSKK